MLKKLYIVAIGILLLFFGSSSQKEEQSEIKTVLGIGVITAPNSSMYSFAEIRISTVTNKMVGYTPLSQDAFLRKGTGLWPSLANPNKENLFEKNGIDCYPIYDSVKRKYRQFACSPLLDLWKLRWSEHPYQHFPGDEGKGWSNGKYRPSNRQQEYLWERYRNGNIMNDYFYGEHMFELFKDMQDSSWIINYQQLKDTI